jgi:hypothetical protein
MMRGRLVSVCVKELIFKKIHTWKGKGRVFRTVQKTAFSALERKAAPAF